MAYSLLEEEQHTLKEAATACRELSDIIKSRVSNLNDLVGELGHKQEQIDLSSPLAYSQYLLHLSAELNRMAKN